MDQNLFDPKLKEAMAEIRAIYRKHDIGGYIILASKTHAEFGFEITPTWAATKWEAEDKVRFRIKQAEVGKEKAAEIAQRTAHLVMSIGDLCRYGLTNAVKMAEILKTAMVIERGPATFTPHQDH